MIKHKCSVINFISLLSKRWTFPLIHSLKKNKSLSFNDLQKQSKNRITARALSLSLKQLVQFGIVIKEKKGIRIVYSLTEEGEKLSHLTKSFRSWCHINSMNVPSSCNLDCLACNYH